MFDIDVCLVCGRYAQVGHAYCSDNCEQLDLSPAVSVCNSTTSSPQMAYSYGGDVPALCAGALGRSSKRYSASSSSTSSTFWSATTDDEDDLSGYSSYGESDSPYDKSSLLAPTISHGLSYTRRPSGTSNHPTVPLLSRHVSTSSSPEHGPQASGSSSSPHDKLNFPEDYSETIGRSSRRVDQPHPAPSAKSTPIVPTTSSRRSRVNRVINPAYFPLLQLGSSPKGRAAAPVLSTVSRSPPTPSAVQQSAVSSTETAFTITSRGRGREPEGGSSFKRSTSCQRQRLTRRSTDSAANVFPTTRTVAESSRGRTTEPKSEASPRLIGLIGGYDFEGPRPRGRMRGSELNGLGTHPEWPGYGNGRSGLRRREHAEAIPALH